MRLVEEFRYFKLQIILLGFLLISTIFVQVADSQINNHWDMLLRDILTASNKLQIHTSQKMLSEFSVFQQLIPYSNFSDEHIERIKRQIIEDNKSHLVINDKIRKVNEKLENDTLSLNEYYSEMVKIQGKLSTQTLNQYNQLMVRINQEIEKGTNWTHVKNYLIVAQLLILLVLAWGYLAILRGISDRISKK